MVVNADSADRNNNYSSNLLYSYNQPGSLPGTISLTEAAPPKIDLIDYNQHQHRYATNLTPEECAAHLDTESVSWVDVGGLGDRATLQRLEKYSICIL